eukprot:TRINITY_DN9709_c0_g1_i1.p1 TRINITY_DN9709_c0_g1~~TRINITY_DN9709_c0_g1_i1.p1  ORF type:complete len:257 (-),score=103.72 TRINITY_DN9709_c0_g1_i1:184-954(-)
MVPNNRMRKLIKKIHEIDSLKQKQAAGEHLELTQTKKIAGEAELRKALMQLQQGDEPATSSPEVEAVKRKAEAAPAASADAGKRAYAECVACGKWKRLDRGVPAPSEGYTCEGCGGSRPAAPERTAVKRPRVQEPEPVVADKPEKAKKEKKEKKESPRKSPKAAPKPEPAAKKQKVASTDVAAQIAALVARKNTAVEAEDYDEAKKCKAEIAALEALANNDEEIKRLSALKDAAVADEDYDLAKKLKNEIAALQVC